MTAEKLSLIAWLLLLFAGVGFLIYMTWQTSWLALLILAFGLLAGVSIGFRRKSNNIKERL